MQQPDHTTVPGDDPSRSAAEFRPLTVEGPDDPVKSAGDESPQGVSSRAAAPQTAAGSPQSDSAAGVYRRILTVLIAEDDPLVCEVLASLITSDPDMKLIGTVGDAHEAISTATAEQPDLVLLDVEMPGGGGPAAARTLATVCPSIRIVAISAHGDKDHVLSMVNEGVSGYVVKGAEPQQVLDTIRRCARGESVFMPPSASTMMREHAVLARDMVAAEVERSERIERVNELCRPEYIDIVFQPIVGLADGEMTALEALARFPQHGEFDTGGWFLEAMDLGMTSQLEIAALRSAMSTVAGSGLRDLCVSINLSPATMLEQDLLPAIQGIAGDKLIVEITEHERIDDYEAVKEVQALLRRSGARVAVDDTGAGFASLKHILALSPDLVKLDISITRDIDNDHARRALAKGLITFAQEIGAAVVAEGIETEGELEVMQELGAHYGQGWFIAKAAPLEELASLEWQLT